MAKNKVGIKGRFALFADNAFVAQDQKLNLIGLFDKVLSTESKPVLNKASLVSNFHGSPNREFGILVKVTNEFGKDVLPPKTLTIKFDGDGNANILINIINLVFENFGRHKATFSYEGEVLAEADLDVIKVKANASAAA